MSAMESFLDNWNWVSPLETLQLKGSFVSQGKITLLSHQEVEWISRSSRLARAGCFQIILVLASWLWIAFSFRQRFRLGISKPELKTSKIALPFEICSQLARAASLAFITVGSVQTKGPWLNVAVIAYIFLLGVLRLVVARDLQWRHLALHQINFLLTGMFAVLVTAEMLPLLDLNSEYRANSMVLSATAGLGLAILTALLTPRGFIPQSLPASVLHRIPERKQSPEETCSWFSYYFTYGWLDPLVWKGAKRHVTMDDLPELPWYDDPAIMLSEVHKAREKGKKTLWTVVRFMSKELTLMGTWIALAYSVELVAPFAMYQLLNYLADSGSACLHPGLWLFLMFLGPVARSIFFNQYIFTSTRLIVRVKSGMTQELYQRAMDSMELEDDILGEMTKDQKGQQQGQKSTNAGRLANLMASDIDAIWQARDTIIVAVGVPIGLILTFIGLYKIVGWSSLVGTVIILLAAPVPAWVAQLLGQAQRRLKLAQDTRISLISEYLASIRAIKYFAWEDAMTKHIEEARGREQNEIWRINVLWVMVSEITDMLPIMALLAIFAVHVGVLKQELTAAVAFTTLSLVSMMRRNVGQMGMMSKNTTSAWISMQRLDRYFENTTPLARYPKGPLSLREATFRRSKKAGFRLRDISIDFVDGGLNVVMGLSGSGKTSLLLSILGETILEKGSVTRPDDVAFASQTTWLQNATIKDNILFHSPFEQARYDQVVEACCLRVDFGEMPDGDITEVGESGTSLSGGQKARVALARALYSKAPLLLLDDIFSALDSKTAASLWEHCFCSDMLKCRTTVLVTNVPWIAPQADLFVTLENGCIKAIEQNIGVTRKPVIHSKDSQNEQQELIENVINGDPSGRETKPLAPKDKKDDIKNEMTASSGSGRNAVFKYMLYFGNPLYAAFAIFTSFMANVAFIATPLWLSVWVDAYSKEEAANVGFYLGLYALFSFNEAITDLIVFLTYANGAWLAAKRLHEMFIRAVMSASLSWYRNIPTGRIVNRFSRDLSSLDNNIHRVLLMFLEDLIKIFFRIGAISSILPIFMLPAFVTCVFGVIAGEMYTRTGVVVKRLVSSSQSPVFSQFSDSLAGLAVIRARASMPGTLGDALAERLRAYSRATETNFNCNRWVALRIDFITALVMLCAGMIAVSKAGVIPAALVGFSLTNATGLSQTILMLVRGMNELEVELQSFNRILEYATVEPEEITDDVRVAEGIRAPDEENPIPYDWPRTGTIEFRNVTIKYDPEGPEILKDINLKFKAGKRVAVIGRTGSGKSTLVLSLLRFTNIVSGTIIYDGVDITHVSRKKLRQALTIIPQEAVLFNGTVGTNLDPSGEIAPDILEKALDSCSGIASFRFRSRESEQSETNIPNGDGNTDSEIDTHPNPEHQPLLSNSASNNNNSSSSSHITYGTPACKASGLSLSTPVDARGENFSHGQRQVLSLCRALVRRSKLMLLDEATASMDPETDAGIQAALRREMSATGGDRTLVTIAHRLRTIADYDTVVVMAAGRVLEVGSPRELFQAGGTFYEMVCHSGEKGELEELILR